MACPTQPGPAGLFVFWPCTRSANPTILGNCVVAGIAPQSELVGEVWGAPGGYARCLGALRGLTFAALDCLDARLDAWDFGALRAFLAAFFAALEWYPAGFCFASMLVVKPKLNASASASARHLMSPILLRDTGKPQIHL